MASQHNSIVKKSSEAIISAPTISIQSEPNESSEALFTLHEGTKVTLLETSNDWSKIKLPRLAPLSNLNVLLFRFSIGHCFIQEIRYI